VDDVDATPPLDGATLMRPGIGLTVMCTPVDVVVAASLSVATAVNGA
jgi:hypothetical protein